MGDILKLKGKDENGVVDDYREAADSVRDLTRQLDVIWNGEAGAARQASLCDMVSQLSVEVPRLRDQRKAMLGEIRFRLHCLFGNNMTHAIVSRKQIDSILNEMEGEL